MSRPCKNVLVFPGGTENGLEILKSLKNQKFIKLFSLTSKVKNHSKYVFNTTIEIDDITHKDFLIQINSVIKEYKIDYIFPANSAVIDYLSRHRSKIDADIIMQDSKVVDIAASKSKTYEVLSDLVPVPKTFASVDGIEDFPVFVKPDRGYGSQGARIIYTRSELLSCVDLKNLVISEFLPGDEYTVECFTDEHLVTTYCSARSRERVRMGTSMHSESASESVQRSALQFAEIIVGALEVKGLWFFQLKRAADGQLKLLEIETRVAGTMAFSRARGVNLPLLYIYQFMGIDASVVPEKYNVVIDRSLSNRFYIDIDFEYVYVDLDDTLVVGGSVNTELISFLYQCINKGISITLITKSNEKDLYKYLEMKKIRCIFDEIIWLNEEDLKSDHIKYRNSIFIDDSFSQRMEVRLACDIPTFDPSMVEVLLDERV